jgi:hypothetical protein
MANPTPVPDMPDLNKNFTLTYNKSCKKNILFLGDGFTEADRQLFFHSVKKISNMIFKNKPFNLGVEKSFNIFHIFTPSQKSGISCDDSIYIDSKGMPRYNVQDPAQVTTNAPLKKLVNKKSALGLKFGYQNSLSSISPKTEDNNLIQTFIAKISEKIPAKYSGIPDCWKDVGNDGGSVFVLVNDDVMGGTELKGGYPFCTVSLGNSWGFYYTKKNNGYKVTISDSTEESGKYDHTPATREKERILDYYLYTSILLHEWGHSHFGLGDEYENSNDNTIIVPRCPNLVTRDDLLVNGTFTPSNAVWYDVISQEVKEFMGGKNKENKPRPLYEKKDDNKTCDSFTGMNFEDNDPCCPSVPYRCWDSPKVIGLYEGGGNKYCGVYRPAGLCKMRSGFDQMTDFCYICMLAIIKKIDPSLEKKLKDKYYPKPFG